MMKIKLILINFLILFFSGVYGMEEYNYKKITVNLMWVNKEIPQYQKYIFPKKIERLKAYEEDTKEIHSFNRIRSWAAHYPVTIWYDSQFVSSDAVINTETKLKKHNLDKSVLLKNVRDLELVKEHPDVFSDEKSLYFRSDLLRVIADIETLYGYKPGTDQVEIESSKPTAFFVYTDWSVNPMDKKTLMDENTVKNLETYGMVMSSNSSNFENNFQITANNNQNLYVSVYHAMIKLNIDRSREIKKQSPQIQKEFEWDHIVYFSYRGMFAFYEHLMGILSMKYEETVLEKPSTSEGLKELDRKLISCFGLKDAYPSQSALCKVKWDTLTLKTIEDSGDYEQRFVSRGLGALIPVKKGAFPTSHFG